MTGEQQVTGARVMVAKGPRVPRQPIEPPDWTRRSYDPALPDWLQLRDDQLDAVERVVKEYETGSRVVFMDAPTGSGKTIMAELVRRRLGVQRGLYVCTTKSLQEQVARDFGYARVLKGRRNYLPSSLTRADRGYRDGGHWDGLSVTCGDCDASPPGVPDEEKSCSYCASVEDCPYQVARREAQVASVGVLNTAFLLTHLNGVGQRSSPFAGRELVIADECDTLEDQLLGFVEVRLAKKWVDALGVEVPKKGSHMTTLRAWLREEVEPGLIELRKQLASGRGLEARREHRHCDQMVQDVRRVLDREDGWVRDGDEEGGNSPNGLVLKPVSVEDVGKRYLWRHGERWLAMSGTVVSADTMADNLGLTAAGIEWGVVELPMRFPVAHRRVVYVPVATMTKKAQDAEGSEVLARMLRAVERVVEKHPGVNVLVHSHTYRLAKEISEHLGRARVDDRPVITYLNARDRDRSMGVFRAAATKGGAVMVAASMDRGVDLPYDLCRVQAIVKIPMASLGSRQVSERRHTPGGDAWYLANTVRNILQMCGRGVRAMDDECVTYVLDSHFSSTLKDGKRRGMWPAWWLDGLELGRVKEMM